ncbi:MAG: hypothetical protein U0521_25230 [Anaerolineae bacterium]
MAIAPTPARTYVDRADGEELAGDAHAESLLGGVVGGNRKGMDEHDVAPVV